ncbi:SH3 domain-binding glutamic acid-rich protein homolog isoform X1 [Halyomorpha halys]|uniref:SH3 domain-binding glutamic acid-rich protein homolog isoform X1 n=1 Tax=Halyomorpha halys TaxID=286706 RepID=UPI0006D4EDCA|nr:SH3 domain-binding glutamic acid-rich protein homolog isoform X1 [Halyomorpha halys]
MVIKVYTSGISGNKEVKKRQQRIMMILDSKGIKYEAIDITEPGKELEKQFMQDNAKAKDSKHPLPPQIFNEEDYCGDYDGFDLANENDVLEAFLKLPLPATPVIEPPPVINGTVEEEIIEEPEEVEVVEEVIEEEPEVVEEEVVEETVHGFCYTPSLAKRLEKALRARIKKVHPKSVHGFCYTPSLATRLTKALERAFLRKKAEEIKKEDINDKDAMDVDNKETDSAVNEDQEVEEGKDEENGDDGGDGDVGGGDAE